MFETAKAIVERLQKATYEAYFVGGCVRDEIMGYIPKDYDIVTTASVVEILAIFNDHKVIDVGAAFGVIKIIVEDEDGCDVEYDVATARADGEYSDNRRPDSIKPATIEEDIMRRDFTMNGLLFDPIKGELLDYVGGAQDIKDGIIRTIGDPHERFAEDPLRLMRAVRFATKYGFELEKWTAIAMPDMPGYLHRISPERIKMELDQILMCDRVVEGLRMLQDTGILFQIAFEVDILSNFEQNPKFHPEGNVFEHTILAIGESVRDLTIRYALLLHDTGKADVHTLESGVIRHKGHEKVSVQHAEAFLDHYKFDNKTKAEVLYLVGQHMRIRKMDEMGIYKQWELYAHPLFEKLVQLSYADSMSTGRVEEANEFQHNKICMYNYFKGTEKYKQMQKFILITGDDCLKVGIEGEDIGKCLKILKKFYIEGRYEDRKELLEHLETHQNNYKEKK